jgi:hypothetical protein
MTDIAGDPIQSGVVLAIPAAIIAEATGKDPRKAAAYAAAAGVLLSLGYKYSEYQTRTAQEQANYALTRNKSVMNSVKSSGANYVAVPVKADKNDPKSKAGVVRVKVNKKSDGTMEAGTVDRAAYASTTASTGSPVKLGGSDAVYYNP